MSLVYYDLETTGLNPPNHEGIEIISIGAIIAGSEEGYEVFIHPEGGIQPGATNLNGFYKDQSGRLRNRQGELPDAWTLKDGLTEFIGWLEEVDCRYLVSFISRKKIAYHCSKMFTFL